jgi:hypothetical protein
MFESIVLKIILKTHESGFFKYNCFLNIQIDIDVEFAGNYNENIFRNVKMWHAGEE